MILLALLFEVDDNRVPNVIVLLAEFPQLVQYGTVQVRQKIRRLR